MGFAALVNETFRKQNSGILDDFQITARDFLLLGGWKSESKADKVS